MDNYMDHLLILDENVHDVVNSNADRNQYKGYLRGNYERAHLKGGDYKKSFISKTKDQLKSPKANDSKSNRGLLMTNYYNKSFNLNRIPLQPRNF